MVTKISCIRCGVCCSSGICSYGIEDHRGLCTFLFVDSYTTIHGTCHTSCKLIVDKKVDLDDVGLGKGCVLRKVPMVYTYYLEQMRNKLIMV